MTVLLRLAAQTTDALDTRDTLGSEPCMQRFAVDEQWCRGYAQECSEYGRMHMKWIAAIINGIVVKRKPLAYAKRGSQKGGRRGGGGGGTKISFACAPQMV